MESNIVECTICLDDTNTTKLHCGHCFHKSCISTWMFTKSTCPNCRAPIIFTNFMDYINTCVIYITTTDIDYNTWKVILFNIVWYIKKEQPSKAMNHICNLLIKLLDSEISRVKKNLSCRQTILYSLSCWFPYIVNYELELFNNLIKELKTILRKSESTHSNPSYFPNS
jgi:hypothetical protein